MLKKISIALLLPRISRAGTAACRRKGMRW